MGACSGEACGSPCQKGPGSSYARGIRTEELDLLTEASGSGPSHSLVLLLRNLLCIRHSHFDSTSTDDKIKFDPWLRFQRRCGEAD